MTSTHTFDFKNNFYNKLKNSYQTVSASPLQNGKLVIFSESAAKLLDLPTGYQFSEEFLATFSGASVPENGHHIAQVYAGHQFGHYVPQLGDGRSIFVGEIRNNHNESIDIHLKGAGQTPFSRMGDGRAVLRSTIREFLASEAMAALHIPTTRALCIIGSDHTVYREREETGAVMTRLAKSHIRFGNFEYHFHHNNQSELTALADFCIQHYYPECATQEAPYLALLTAIVKQTAIMIAKWQAIGFCHGVMNTDNMSIVGETIDYGPFAFMDDYEPGFICNHSDHTGRYAFEQQPGIGLWNLNALAYTFSNWLARDDIDQALATYEPILVQHYLGLMQSKFGLQQNNIDDRPLLSEYLRLLAKHRVDYTLAFRLLNQIQISDQQNQHCQPFLALFSEAEEISNWLDLYRHRLATEALADAARHKAMDEVNPLYILRNYLAQQAIEKAQDQDFSEIKILLTLLSSPFKQAANMSAYAQATPPWGKHMEISCSS